MYTETVDHYSTQNYISPNTESLALQRTKEAALLNQASYRIIMWDSYEARQVGQLGPVFYGLAGCNVITCHDPTLHPSRTMKTANSMLISDIFAGVYNKPILE